MKLKRCLSPFSQDQIGARIVTFYPSDIAAVSDIVTRYFHPIESKEIVPDGDNEFGYVGKHFILLLPTDVTANFRVDSAPDFFELKLRRSSSTHGQKLNMTWDTNPLCRFRLCISAKWLSRRLKPGVLIKCSMKCSANVAIPGNQESTG
jgi:hypothetical protein